MDNLFHFHFMAAGYTTSNLMRIASSANQKDSITFQERFGKFNKNGTRKNRYSEF